MCCAGYKHYSNHFSGFLLSTLWDGGGLSVGGVSVLWRVHDIEEVRGDQGCNREGEWGPGRRRLEVDKTRGIYEIYL